VILGGVIVEEKEEGDQVFLRLKNRPLDKDYVPHRPPSLDGSEAGYYWLTLSRHDLPNQYREWARVTVVGRVEGTRSQGEPLLNALYLRGWGEAVIETKKWKSV
jgi:starvation-inducible outer membrane lipoprotein